MLVYANHLAFQGTGADEAVFKAVGGWLKEQLGYGLRPEQLREDGDFDGYRDKDKARSWLRVCATNEEDPQLYSWVLRTNDPNVYGRQWFTELGLRIVHGDADLTCLVKVDDQSTLVADPVSASRPRVIIYAVNNILKASGVVLSASVPGVSLKMVGQDVDTYRGLLAEIERRDRNFPIVLVSPTVEGNYLIDPVSLQQDLVGLAQVVQIAPSFNSYEMAEILGERWSAWGGSVNILNMPSKAGFVRGRFFLADEIEKWGDKQTAKVSQVLAWVTSNTNIPRLREHIRPEGVVQLALRRRLHMARARSDQMDAFQLRLELEKASHLAEEQADWIKTLEEDNDRLESDLSEAKTKQDEAKESIAKKNFTIEALKNQLGSAGAGRTNNLDGESLLQLACRMDQPVPSECLDAIAKVYGDRCIILDSAVESASDVNRFIYGRKLLDMLRRLVTEYRDKLLEGGDSNARLVFGKNEYAATESETVMGNKAMRRARTFQYLGEPVEMFRHLKINVEDDVTKTIRVHFHWDADRSKIVIGYCGEHLPVASH
jgi:hypothetical protein